MSEEEKKQSVEKKLKLDDLEARPRDIDDEKADEITGGRYIDPRRLS